MTSRTTATGLVWVFLTLVPSAPAADKAQLDSLLNAAVAKQAVPAVVAMVANREGIVYRQAVNAAEDTIFAIASMTKPVTSVAVMQLVEAGRVKLDAPAATYLKELTDRPVLAAGKLRPAKSPVTVRSTNGMSLPSRCGHCEQGNWVAASRGYAGRSNGGDGTIVPISEGPLGYPPIDPSWLRSERSHRGP